MENSKTNLIIGKHKNSNDAVGNYGIYQIMIDDVIYKIGKADLDRITKSTNTATRIHQQVRKLRKKYVKQNVFYILLEELLGSTTSHAKKVEQAILESLLWIWDMFPKAILTVINLKNRKLWKLQFRECLPNHKKSLIYQVHISIY